jgi:cell division protein FtsI/penicillin-binding protein 2
MAHSKTHALAMRNAFRFNFLGACDRNGATLLLDKQEYQVRVVVTNIFSGNWVMIMAVSEEVQQAIVNKLGEGPCRPTELLKSLIDQGFTESEVRETVSQLLNEEKILLTGQQVLQNQVAA